VSGSSDGGSSGLSGGAIAGIVIGCIVGAALICLVLLYLIFQGTRKGGVSKGESTSPVVQGRGSRYGEMEPSSTTSTIHANESPKAIEMASV